MFFAKRPMNAVEHAPLRFDVERRYLGGVDPIDERTAPGAVVEMRLRRVPQRFGQRVSAGGAKEFEWRLPVMTLTKRVHVGSERRKGVTLLVVPVVWSVHAPSFR